MDRKAQKLLNRFGDASIRRMAQSNAKEAPTQPLFHYTTEAALYSILKSETFWFTSIYHMDDDAELHSLKSRWLTIHFGCDCNRGNRLALWVRKPQMQNTRERVPAHTDRAVTERIRRETEERVQFLSENPYEIRSWTRSGH
jgi:hypothetical protein